MLILLKNNLNGNKNNFGNAILIQLFLGVKFQNMWRHTKVGGDLRNVTTCDKEGGGVKKSLNSCDVIYGWPLIRKSYSCTFMQKEELIPKCSS